jgi:hypothetical protein
MFSKLAQEKNDNIEVGLIFVQYLTAETETQKIEIQRLNGLVEELMVENEKLRKSVLQKEYMKCLIQDCHYNHLSTSECPICFNTMNYSRLTVMECGHVACRSCVDIMIQNSNECGVCRSKINDDDEDGDAEPDGFSDWSDCISEKEEGQ